MGDAALAFIRIDIASCLEFLNRNWRVSREEDDIPVIVAHGGRGVDVAVNLPRNQLSVDVSTIMVKRRWRGLLVEESICCGRGFPVMNCAAEGTLELPRRVMTRIIVGGVHVTMHSSKP